MAEDETTGKAVDPLRVLIVEDNPALARVVQFNLSAAGIDAEIAPNGQRAWERLQSSYFDVIVTDEQMPEMTGVELVRNLRESSQHAETQIVMLTAKRYELDVVGLEALGVTNVLAKPFSPQALVRLVQDLCPAC